MRAKGRMIIGVMALASLASEILDFWFVPRAGEAVTNDETQYPHSGPLPRSGEGAATPRVRVTRDVWFRKDDAFDEEIRARFGAALAAGIAGAFGDWCTTPTGCLARVVLLDQFTRNAFRGTPDAFAGDVGALATAEDAVERGFDRSLEPLERGFLYMPFEHSELIEQQDRAVALFAVLATETGLGEQLPWAERHRDVIRRFGRFPHRNEILGRASTPEEVAFLDQPGSRF
jgi:uncharacterized protein (DUF924 family)